MNSIEWLEMVALACKALREVPGLDNREARQAAKGPPDGACGRKAKLRAAVAAIAAGGASTVVKLSDFARCLILFAEHLGGIGS